jgi:hypothetical protein
VTNTGLLARTGLDKWMLSWAAATLLLGWAAVRLGNIPASTSRSGE